MADHRTDVLLGLQCGNNQLDHRLIVDDQSFLATVLAPGDGWIADPRSRFAPSRTAVDTDDAAQDR